MGGAIFSSNFLLWSESGYFDLSAEVKPLLHLWSLAIEEQFYIFWPLLVMSLSFLRINSFITTLVLLILSLGCGLWLTYVEHNLVAGFYAPPARFWEIFVGAMLACSSNKVAAPKKWVIQNFINQLQLINNIRSTAGIFLIVISVLVIHKDFAFPGFWAVLPTAGALLLLSAGPEGFVNKNILSSRLLVLLGLISYSLYLWHWPILSLLRIIEGQTPSFAIRLLAIITSIFIATFTYAYIEKPFRNKKNQKVKVFFY